MRKLLLRLFPETSALRLLFHRAKAFLAAVRYGFPARKLTMIGVTGTDGKTTTVGMVAHVLNACGMRTGAISTAFFRVADDIRWNPTQKTSPSPFLVQKFLRELVTSGCTHAVIECSSHGLLQGRVNHTYPIVAGITNVSEEHLDYHGSMEEYIHAKSLLFRMLRGRGAKVLHFADRSFLQLSEIPSSQTILFNRNETAIDSRTGAPLNLWLEEICQNSFGSSAALVWKKTGEAEQRFPLQLFILGLFNLENALCAIGCILSLREPPELKKITEAFSSFKGVSGRMESIDVGQKFSVFVDFTVTPKSYESTLTTLRSVLEAGKHLIVLTGSCGDRMREKRPLIGNLCSTIADITVVTNEDPYAENPETIIDEVLTGIAMDVPIYKGRAFIPETPAPRFCVRISDRLEAIRTALSLAKKGDIVLFAGKGADVTMMTAAGQIPWNEREIVTGMLRDAFADANAPQHDNENRLSR